MSASEDASAATAPSSGFRKTVKLLMSRPELSALAMAILVVIGFQIWTGGIFISVDNMKVVLPVLPELGIVALGVVILMIAGEFDLSVGSVFALVPMLGHILMTRWGLDPYSGLALSLIAGIACGWVNGIITLTFGIPSFITTLGMFYVARSLAVVLVGGFPPPMPSNVPLDPFVYNFGAFRASLIWYAGIAVILALVLHTSNFGNWIYATGGQRLAAQDMGINVRRVKIICFMLCSFLAGFAGTLQTYRLKQPLPNIGTGLELEAIAAAVIGGALLTGGVGSIVGAIIGAFLIRAIDNGLVMSRVNGEWFRAFLGVLLVLAVIVNIVIRRRASEMKVK
ncbi:MAG: ABC transporter permease [Alphaproteobacteria bacterium]